MEIKLPPRDKKSGRFQKDPNRDRCKISIVFERDLRDRLNKACEEEGISAAQLIRDLVEDWLES